MDDLLSVATKMAHESTLDRLFPLWKVKLSHFGTILDTTEYLDPTYYVDYVGGADTNNGLSTGAPFKHCPGDASATGVAASTVLGPADVVNFKGGVQYNGEIDIAHSGSAGYPIIFQSSGSWGSGKAAIDGNSATTKGFVIGSTRAYITIDGFEIRNLLPAGNGYECAAIYGQSSPSHCIIKNCYFHNNGYWMNDGVASIQGIGITLTGASYCILSNNIISYTGYIGINIESSNNITIDGGGSIGPYVNWGIHVSSYYTNTSAITIQDTTIHDNYMYGTPFWTGPGHPADHPHTDGIFITADASSYTIDDVLIERCKFYNDVTFTMRDGTADIYVEGGSSEVTNVTIRNSLFLNSQSCPIWGRVPGMYIYNNTLFSAQADIMGIYVWGKDRADVVTIKNNVIYANRVFQFSDHYDSDNVVSDYNYFISARGTPFYTDSPNGERTLVQWQAVHGQDSHSVKVDAPATAGFTDISGYPTASSTMDLTPQSGSPLIGPVPDIAGFGDDFFGLSRPTGTWNYGAIQYEWTAAGNGGTLVMVLK